MRERILNEIVKGIRFIRSGAPDTGRAGANHESMKYLPNNGKHEFWLICTAEFTLAPFCRVLIEFINKAIQHRRNHFKVSFCPASLYPI